MKTRKSLTRLTVVLMAAVMLVLSIPFSSYAASNTNLRSKVVGAAGIMNVDTGLNDAVTRKEFASMLARASKYRDVLTSTSNVSIFPDVPAGNEYASAIRLCAEHDWMGAYLGGVFRPDQPVTLAEAEKGLLGLLGYTSADFTGDQYNKRHSKAASLDILENISKVGTDQLTKTDCVNLFYNLLRCKNTENKDYVTVLGGTLGTDGEVNATSFATDNSLKGPKYFVKSTGLTRFEQWLPFAANDGTMYLNGEVCTFDYLQQQIKDYGLICYYNSTSKVVWSYSCDGSIHNGKGALRGTITGIEYSSADTLTPSAVCVDGYTFKLTTTDMQFAFGIYGSCKVGETVTIIYTADDTGTSNYDGTVVDYIYGE